MRRGVGLLLAACAACSIRPPAAASQEARASAAEWVAVARADRATRGVPGTATIELTARAGFHVNEEYPLNFRPAAAPGLAFGKARFDRADGLVLEPCAAGSADACVAKLPVTFTPAAVGTLAIAGTLAFSVCNPEKCLIEQVELTAPVEVSEPE